jgi:ornithine lipid hydroxylase
MSIEVTNVRPIEKSTDRASIPEILTDHLMYIGLLAASFALAWFLSTHGLAQYADYSQGWKIIAIGALTFWGCVAVLRLIEQVRPFERAWNRDPGGQLVNDIVLTMSAPYLIYPLLGAGVAVAASWAIDHWHSLNYLHVWPTHWPALIAIPLGLVVYDFVPYWAHRLNHKIPLFWRFHSVHHSSARLSAINAGRAHPGEGILSTVIGAPFAMLLGLPGEYAVWYFALGGFGHILTHANIKMRYGLFSYIINTPELHRWHHSRHQRETDTNYGEVTVVWDHIFGTFYHPKRRPHRDVGVDFPVSAKVLEQFIQPLTLKGHQPKSAVMPALPPGEAGSQ